MDPEKIAKTILSNTFTKADLARRVRLLRQYMETCFYKPEKTEMTKFLINERATTEDINSFITWGDDFFRHFTKENTYKIIEQVEEMLKKMHLISMYIPYEPVPAEVVKLGKWFRGNVGDEVIIDLRTDPTLLGGCAFVFKGIYRDYSLRYYMAKKRDEIAKMISDYVAKFYKN
jgi:F0F1-type ATP synthase delta subunit